MKWRSGLAVNGASKGYLPCLLIAASTSDWASRMNSKGHVVALMIFRSKAVVTEESKLFIRAVSVLDVPQRRRDEGARTDRQQ
jgi:hypothetical protein